MRKARKAILFEEAKLAVQTIPKNGGTTIWHMAYYLKYGRACHGNVYRNFSPQTIPLDYQEAIVVRDPVDRFVSAYRNCCDKRGLKLPFDEFVSNFRMVVRKKRDWLHHFRPQSSFIKNPASSFDRVFRHSRFCELIELLVSFYGKFPEIRLDSERHGETITHAQKSYSKIPQVKPEHIAKIKLIYAKDYKLGFTDTEKASQYEELTDTE